VDFNSIDIDIPNAFFERKGKSLTGKDYVYQTGSKRRWELKFSRIASADAAYINAWRAGNTPVRFYPDFIAAPTTYYTVTLQNKENPFRKMIAPIYNRYFEGEIQIQEV
jgi:hypothetical protein